MEVVRNSHMQKSEWKILEYYRWLLCFLVGAVPAEGLFYPIFKYLSVDEYRTPSFFLGLMATVFSIFFIPQIVRAVKKSYFIIFMFLANLVALGVHYFQLWEPDKTTNRMLPFKMLFMATLLLLLVEKPVWRKRMINAYLVGWVIFVLFSVYYIVTNQAVLVHYGDILRAKALLQLDANIHSLTTMTGMVICFNRMLSSDTLRKQIGYVILWMMGLSAIFFGASRTGSIILVIATLFSVAYYLWFNRKNASLTRRIKIIIISTNIVLVGTFLVVHMDFTRPYVLSLGNRFNNTLDRGDYGKRYALSMATLDVALDNPSGIGLGNSMGYLRGHDPHNDYFKMLAEGGVLAGAIMLVGFGFLLRNWMKWRYSKSQIGSLIVLLALLIANFTIQGFTKQFFWVFFAMFAVPPPRGYFRQEHEEAIAEKYKNLSKEQKYELLVRMNSKDRMSSEGRI